MHYSKDRFAKDMERYRDLGNVEAGEKKRSREQ